MKNPIVFFFRTTFISWEAAAVLACVSAWMNFPSIFAWGDKALAGLERPWPLVPFAGLVATAITLSYKVLFPKDNPKILAQWDEYPNVRTSTMVAIAYVGLGAGCVAVGTFGQGSLPGGIASMLVTAGYAVAFISVFSLLQAMFVVRSMMSGGK